MQKVGNDNTTGIEIDEFGLAIQIQINKGLVNERIGWS